MYGFAKKNRICSLKEIGTVFASGKTIHASFITLKYLVSVPGNGNVSVLVSVSKRSFKKAVDRNFIKRLMRESFRQNQQKAQAIATKLQADLKLAFLFRGNKIPDYKSCESKIILTLQRLSEYYADPAKENTDRTD